MSETRPRVLFINAGLLGARTFGKRLFPVVARQTSLQLSQILLTDELSLTERATRRVVCQRLWPARLQGFNNLDLARYRQEWHAGTLARRRLNEHGASGFDVLVFYRQPTAYRSLPLMRNIRSIVAIDCTQMCMLRAYSTALERATLTPNIRRDGLVFDAARAVVCSSAWAARTLRELYPRCATPSYVIPPPVDVAAFPRDWIASRQARAAGTRPRVLFVGGEFERKGGPQLLRLWESPALHERAELHIMTDWPLDQRRLPPRVFVHRGVQAYSPAWSVFWREGDLFAFPTRHEAFGNVLQEAAAAGLPRITTRENAAPELIEEGRTGLLVDPGDAPALARAIAALIADHELRRRMGAAARESVVRTASPDVYARALESVVLGVLPKPS